MTEESRRDPSFWAELRRHPSFQTAVVFGGGSWLAVQAADVFGVDTVLLRWLGGMAVLVLLALFTVACMGVLRQRQGGTTHARGLRPRTVAAVTTGLLLLGTGAWVARPLVFSGVRPGADVIAVLPFQSSGSGVELLGEGLVDLLSTNLDEVGPIRTVNPRTLLHHYRQHAQDGHIDLDGALRVGRAVGAGSVVIGSVVSAGGGVRVSAALHAVDGGRVLARAQKSGSAENVLGLVDELSIELMRDIWRSREPLPELRVSAITTPSIAAIRAYLRGEQYYRQVRWDSAAVAFEEAVAHDSTFALAHFRLGETYGWRESLGSQQARIHSDAAARFADRLPARERALVVAHRLHEFGDVAAIDSFQAYTNRYPDDVAGWYMLADVKYHAAPILGLDLAQLVAGFSRAHDMDATYAQAYAHLFELSLMTGDSARYATLATNFARVSPEESSLFELLSTVKWDERSAALAAIERAVAGSGPRTMLNRVGAAATMRAFGPSPDPDFVIRAIELMADAMGPGAEQMVAQTKASILAATGRMREADRVLQSVRTTELALGIALPYIVSGPGVDYAFQEERERLRTAPARRQASYWRAIQALSAGDAAAATREIGAARRDTTARGQEIVPEMIDGLAGWLAIVRGDTIDGVRRLRTAVLAAGYSPGAAGMMQPLRAQLAIVQASRPATRAEGIRRLELMSVMEPHTLPFFHRALADALIADGRTADAAAVLARFADLWANADPELQPLVEAARAALMRLSPDRAARGG
jgi:TolB-like protein